MGNAGTAIRPLTAALAVIGGDYTLHGVSRMHERPIGDLVDALNAVGAQIEYTGEQGFPPLRIRRGHITANRMAVRGNVSSQFLTALLMAAPLMARDASGLDRRRRRADFQALYRDHAEPDAPLRRRRSSRMAGPRSPCSRASAISSPGTIHVEGDASSASYFLAAGAIARRAGAGRRRRAATASRATCALPMRSSGWAPSSRAARTGSRCNRTAC